MFERRCDECGNQGNRVILYTVIRPPRAGDALCGPCLMDAGGPLLLHQPEDERYAADAARRPILLLEADPTLSVRGIPPPLEPHGPADDDV